MSKPSVQRQSADVLQGGDDTVDLRIDLRVEKTEETLVAAGGEWCGGEVFDYVGPGGRARVLRVVPSQERAARWWAGWLPAYLATLHLGAHGIKNRSRKYRKWSILFYGGRRGGKTKLATWCCAQFAVARSEAIIWIVSPTDEKTFEVRRYIQEIIPETWAKWRENEETGEPHYEFINGSRIFCVSGFKPDSTKMGEAHLVFINEGQLQHEKVFHHARGATSDTGGLVIVAANPPDQVAGLWVDEFKTQAQAGQRDAVCYEFDANDNPKVVQEALDSMSKEMDADTYERERRGVFIPIKDRVFYFFSDKDHIYPVGHDPRDRGKDPRRRRRLSDVTAGFLEYRLAVEGFPFLAGCDFQLQPMVAVIKKYFACPLHDRCVIEWTVDEVVIDGNERKLLDELARRGYKPENLVSVGDASASWQNADRDDGPPSYGYFRERGYLIFRPDEDFEKNPDVEEAAKAANDRLRDNNGHVHAYVDPKCVHTIRSLKKWPRRNALVHKRHELSHAGQAWYYPIWRFWPRRVKDQSEFTYKGLPDARPGIKMRDSFGGY